jgi:glutamate racemase
MASDPKGPIGIFDSGIGGLTVLAAIRRRLPHEDLLYLGDTARVPYGTKSAETVIRYARQCAQFLAQRGVKAIVVACNTASAYALPELRRHFDLPILGVVEPGAQVASEASRSKVIGVIGTAGTIGSNAYGQALKALDSEVRVVSRACPLFVPLVEEGWTDDQVAQMVVHRYLGDMKSEGIDTLILGCTHYPLLADIIRRELGDGVEIVDSAWTTALALDQRLNGEAPAKARTEREGSCRIYVTDMPARFEAVARRFLGHDLPSVMRVDL